MDDTNQQLSIESYGLGKDGIREPFPPDYCIDPTLTSNNWDLEMSVITSSRWRLEYQIGLDNTRQQLSIESFGLGKEASDGHSPALIFISAKGTRTQLRVRTHIERQPTQVGKKPPHAEKKPIQVEREPACSGKYDVPKV